MHPVVIGLAGPAGSGKSTAAEILAREHGFVRTRFAAPLKAMMAAFFRECGLTDDDILARLEGPRKEHEDPLLCGRTPRYAMQTLGTEWGRETIGRDLWVNAWRETACRALDENGRIVVEDVRFADEAAAVRGLGGVVLGLRGRGGISGAHVSESGVEADVTVWNDGPVEILAARVAGVLARLQSSYRRDISGSPG